MEEKKMCFNIDEMAEQLGIGLTNAYKLVKSKSFYPAKKIGDRDVVSCEQLNKWLNEQGKKEAELLSASFYFIRRNRND